ncbi:MAG: hypothetical protein IJS70_10345 [Bacteroidales bacterium]|nr:hypothetical protein [Bacteroidales bacterium]
MAKRLIPERTVSRLRRLQYRFQRLQHNFHRVIQGEARVKTDYEYVEFSAKNAHTFFGYYDVSPFGTHNRVVYIEVPDDQSDAAIVLNDIGNNRREIVAHSKAWNWQQGCRLRWFPWSEDDIIFNDFRDGKYVSRRLNVKSGEEILYPFPIYDISPDGKYAVSLDFTRLGYKRPGYGYTELPFDKKRDILDSGITVYSMDYKEEKAAVSFSKIAEVLDLDSSNQESWYVNHLSFSPGGESFLFFFVAGDGSSFKASLLVYDIRNKTIMPLETELKVSHYAWRDDSSILCTAYDSSGSCRYYIYTLEPQSRVEVDSECLSLDGHPSFISDGAILTDTYPDASGYQHIFIYDFEDRQKRAVADVFDVKSLDAEHRTDLHPRYDPAARLVSFDANASGHRSFYILKIN